MNGSVAMLHPEEITSLAAALAGADPLAAVLRAIHELAVAKIGVTVFSASRCLVNTHELDRIYSSHSDVYPVGVRKSKRETGWARQVIQNRQVFVGEGALEMAAAFDDQERMATLGVRSIVNVPIVLPGGGLGVLNFGRNVERVMPADVTTARLLGLVASAGFALERCAELGDAVRPAAGAAASRG